MTQRTLHTCFEGLREGSGDLRKELLALLVAQRAQVAQQVGTAPRYVAPNSSLQEMTLLLPTSQEELTRIWAMRNRAARYGEHFLSTICRFAESHALQVADEARELSRLVRQLAARFSCANKQQPTEVPWPEYAELEQLARALPLTSQELAALRLPAPLSNPVFHRDLLDVTVRYARMNKLCDQPGPIPHEATTTPPLCPTCQEPMAARTSSGSGFWGCSQFPDCQGTRCYLPEFDLPEPPALQRAPSPTAPPATSQLQTKDNGWTTSGTGPAAKPPVTTVPHAPSHSGHMVLATGQPRQKPPTSPSLSAEELDRKWGPIDPSFYDRYQK